MTLNEAIELTEIRKKMVQSQCESCWSEDAEIGLQCMYLVRDMMELKWELEQYSETVH